MTEATERSSEAAVGESVPFWRRPLVRRLLTGLLGLYWTALFIATHIQLPKSSDVKVDDKLLHFAAYGLLGFLIAWVLAPCSRRRLAWFGIVAVCTTYGMLDELLQSLIPGRTADAWDWMADTVGAGIGAGVVLWIQYLWFRRPQSEAVD